MRLDAQMKRIAALAGGTVLAGLAFSASHSDAPMMVLDPSANITDVYAFLRTNTQGKKVLNLSMNVNPLEDPGNGVIYDKFSDDVIYQIHIAKPVNRNGQWVFTGESAMHYEVRFTTTYKNGNTILSYGLGTEAGPILRTDDARQNFLQRYTVTLVKGNQRIDLTGNQTLKTPPVNVGPRTTPNYYDAQGNRLQGAMSTGEQPIYTQETVYRLNDGSLVFAGQREDGFYADTPAIFDFLGVRNPGKDGFSGTNVHTISFQVPVENLVGQGERPEVGVYATTWRQSFQISRTKGQAERRGPWVQVSRMGNPLFNEVLVPLKDKDRYNMVAPTRDTSVFSTYAENPELATLLNVVLGTNIVTTGRADLVGFFIPDVIKVDLSTEDVPLAGEPKFNRLSVFGGDTVASTLTGGQVAAGWPNGRRFGDDVVDIALTALASGPSYSTIVPLGDNSNANDTKYDLVFPYAGTPWGGPGTTLR